MELEALVAAQIHQLLQSAHKYLTGNKTTPEAELVLQRAKDLAARWPDLATFERREFIRAVVKTVTLGQKNLWIEVHRLKLVTRLAGRSPTEVSGFDSRNPSVIKLTVDFQPIRRGVELRILAPDGGPTHGRPIPALVKAVARAREWRELLISGEVGSVEEIARNSGFECRYVRKILQSAALSPEICEAILSGKQAPHLTIRNLQSGLPLDWQQQARELLATP
jgi:hypothetical protein